MCTVYIRSICSERTDKLSTKEYLYYQKKLLFLHSMMCCVHTVLTSVVEFLFILCNFAYASPYGSKSKIERRVTAKFACKYYELSEYISKLL